MIEVLITWWMIGVIGGLLFWLDWKLTFPMACGRCPSRKGALAIFLAGILGVCGLCAALLSLAATVVMGRKSLMSESRFSEWWNKPIC